MASDTQKEKVVFLKSAEASPRRRDHIAFEDVVRRETPRLYRIILRLVRDEDEAQSLVQETFLRAYQGLDGFRREAAFSTWLIGIGLNVARASLRKRKREDVLREEDIERLQPDFRLGRYARPPRAWCPQHQVERSERTRLVRSAIERLPEKYRIVITLRDLEELSTEEAAEVLEISRGSVRVRLHRARQALRALIEERFKEDEL